MLNIHDLASGKAETYRFVLQEYGGIILDQYPGLSEDAKALLLGKVLSKLLKQARKRPQGNAQAVMIRVLAKSAGMTDELLAKAPRKSISDVMVETALANWAASTIERGRQDRLRSYLGGVSVLIFIIVIIVASVLIYKAQLGAGITH